MISVNMVESVLGVFADIITAQGAQYPKFFGKI